MNKKRNRAWRRQQDKNSVNKALNIFKHRDYRIDSLNQQEFKLIAKKNHNNMTTCSNPFCCGNPRRMRGRTVLTKGEVFSLIDLQYKED